MENLWCVEKTSLFRCLNILCSELCIECIFAKSFTELHIFKHLNNCKQFYVKI